MHYILHDFGPNLIENEERIARYTDTETERLGDGGLCALWWNGTNYAAEPQWVHYVQQENEGLASLNGSLCRGTIKGCSHPGGGSCSCSFFTHCPHPHSDQRKALLIPMGLRLGILDMPVPMSRHSHRILSFPYRLNQALLGSPHLCSCFVFLLLFLS